MLTEEQIENRANKLVIISKRNNLTSDQAKYLPAVCNQMAESVSLSTDEFIDRAMNDTAIWMYVGQVTRKVAVDMK